MKTASGQAGCTGNFRSLKSLSALVLAAVFCGASPVLATPILDSSLASFAVLGASSVTNTGPTTLGGNLGVSNNSSITGIKGFLGTLANDGPGTFSGTDPLAHQGDAFSILAGNQLVTAVTTLNGMGPGTTLANGDLTLAGTLNPGVYTVPFATSNLTGTLTLDGLGLASTSIVMNDGVTINCGRALAHTGAVTMINDTISGVCAGGYEGSGGFNGGGTNGGGQPCPSQARWRYWGSHSRRLDWLAVMNPPRTAGLRTMRTTKTSNEPPNRRQVT